MTREEREKMIEEASEMFKTKGHYACFRLGVIFADAHPKSPWISVKDDLPCNHNELIRSKEVSEGTETVEVFAINEHGDIWSDYMIYENGKWRWNDFEPAFWMLAPKLPKE